MQLCATLPEQAIKQRNVTKQSLCTVMFLGVLFKYTYIVVVQLNIITRTISTFAPSEQITQDFNP